MSQYYFRAKAKPKATTSPTESPVSPQAESPVSTPSTAPPDIAPAVVEQALPEPALELVSEPVSEPALEPADLSSYCFIRNKLMLSSTIKLPAPEVIALIAKLHLFAANEKVSIASLLDKLYRQPEKSSNEEGAGEALMYQPADLNLDGLAQPIQDWIQEVLALDPESFRKSAIWFSRYCYDSPKTIAELGISVS
jgi:hypothetical protein